MGKKEVIERACNENILIPDELKRGGVRGIYGIFLEKDDVRLCLYIGKSYDIADRLFGSGGHITRFIMHEYDKLVPQLIRDNKDNGNKIVVEILERVEYQGDNFARDMQRLAYAEISLIEEYQKKGECLQQLPEGTRMKESTWVAKYKKEINIEND